MRLHVRRSAKCRAEFEDLNKTKVVQKRCREAAAAALKAGSCVSGHQLPWQKVTPHHSMECGRAASESSVEGAGDVKEVTQDGSQALLKAGVQDTSDCESEGVQDTCELPHYPCQDVNCGIGGEIVNMKGRSLGHAVAEEKRCWRLAYGRIARKAMEGKKWRWAALEGKTTEVPFLQDRLLIDSSSETTSASVSISASPSLSLWPSPLSSQQEGSSPFSFESTPLMLPEPSSQLPALDELDAEPGDGQEEPDSGTSATYSCTGWGSIGEQKKVAEHTAGSISCVGCKIIGMDGRDWGQVVSGEPNCWRFSDGRMARKDTEGRKWRWASQVPQSMRGSHRSLEHTADNVNEEHLPELVIISICNWLPLHDVLRSVATCKAWSACLSGHVPLTLPPPQVDALLQFCLLEVLVCFDDGRLPLPMSAIWDDMRKAGRRAIASPSVRIQLENLVFRNLGPANRSQQEEFLREQRPHHVAFSIELKGSGFRTLERLGKHYDSENIIEVLHQRWHKQIHNSPNTRTCTEWLLTKVNRAHPLFLEHQVWRHNHDERPSNMPL